MLPVIIIIVSSLVLVFSVLRKKSFTSYGSSVSNMNSYYSSGENTNATARKKVLLDAAIANLDERKEGYSKKYVIRHMYNQRLVSPMVWNKVKAKIKDLEYEELVIEAEADTLSPGWNIFNEANKALPQYKKKRRKCIEKVE